MNVEKMMCVCLYMGNVIKCDHAIYASMDKELINFFRFFYFTFKKVNQKKLKYVKNNYV